MTLKRALGTCYYPEHWSEDIWREDAARMADLGLTWVRIGEFAWSRLEPARDQFDWGWMDRAIEILGEAGLRVVLGTPTATPPRWVVDAHPDMLAVDAMGHPRGFGSRRHYCFSHQGYFAEAMRITEEVAKRYGANPHVAAWQTDNEYGCHDTVISYSPAARDGFRDWLAQKYQSAQALNRAWGNVFWSMDYDSFEQIELPNLTVTEPNPAHALDFRRYASDQVARFNQGQVDIIRRHSTAPVSHNYMGRITEFDHFELGRQMEIATWDSYPLGFLEDRLEETPEHKRAYARQGDPDFQALHHDLYRAVGHGRWWVMEQQPGPVNWAPHNPAPLDGMVRFWTWEAFAHGAEVVSYFRWRQAPFAQEQYHAGMLRPDGVQAPAFHEVAEVMAELAHCPDVETAQAPVALVFDYASAWAWEVQPQGRGLDYFRLVFETYRAARKLGLSLDILPPDTSDLSGYDLVLIPGAITLAEPLLRAVEQAKGTTIIGPRANAKTRHLSIPDPLPPNLPGLEALVTRVETMRPDMPVDITGGGAVKLWLEEIETRAEVLEQTTTGAPVLLRAGKLHYLAGWPDEAFFERILSRACEAEGIAIEVLPEGIRIRQSGSTRFIFNHRAEPVTYAAQTIPPAGVIRVHQ